MHLYNGDSTDQLIRLALAEDLGTGDITSEALLPPNARGKGVVMAKQDLVLAGTFVAARVFELLDPKASIRLLKKDGDRLRPGEHALEVESTLPLLLSGERTALNFLQRLSGVASHTSKAVEALAGSKTRLLDTRKTTPGFRNLEKRAVRAGGAHGHRSSLSDGVMIKDNHIAAVGSIGEAVRRARAFVHPLVKIEVEVKNLSEVDEALAAGADMLLLDNMNDEELAQAVSRVAGRVPTEASGNMNIERLPRVAATGVDFVSMGALTHSAPAADLSFVLTASELVPALGNNR